MSRSLAEVNFTRQDYYNYRLALAEERIFSNSDHFIRPKLDDGVDMSKDSLTRVYNISSIIGSNKAKWIVGMINQREDGEYYLEDARHSVRLSFSELVYADPEVFFTDGSTILC